MNNATEARFEQEVSRETESHGRKWSQMYGGYFSNPEVVEAFLKVIYAGIQAVYPDAIADLGGGTGFVLERLLDHQMVSSATRLFDLDLSEAQLSQIHSKRIEAQCTSMMEFTRDALIDPQNKLLLFTRSTLHYAGIFGLEPVLQHIREQMMPGELFIHQSACCGAPEDALLLSELFERLGTDKWMPPTHSLEEICERVGFVIEQETPALPLLMFDSTLADRYHQTPEQMQQICRVLCERYPESTLLKQQGDHLTISVLYTIFTCRAI